MKRNNDDLLIQEKIKRLLGDPPKYTFSAQKRRELIGRLYEVSEERKRLVDYIPAPIRSVPVYARVAVMLFIAVSSYEYLFSPVAPVLSNAQGVVKVYRAAKNEW